MTTVGECSTKLVIPEEREEGDATWDNRTRGQRKKLYPPTTTHTHTDGINRNKGTFNDNRFFFSILLLVESRSIGILEDRGSGFGNFRDGTFEVKGLGEHNLEDLLDVDGMRCRTKDQWCLHGACKLAGLEKDIHERQGGGSELGSGGVQGKGQVEVR